MFNNDIELGERSHVYTHLNKTDTEAVIDEQDV